MANKKVIYNVCKECYKEVPTEQAEQNSALSDGVSTKYIVEVRDRGQWFCCTSYETLMGAKREKAKMEALSSSRYRIVRQTRETVKEC